MRREKKFLQTVWEGKKFPAHQVARKKNLADQKSPPPPPQELNGRPLSVNEAKHETEINTHVINKTGKLHHAIMAVFPQTVTIS